MELSVYLKAVLESEQSAIVVCDLEHKIVYMNSFAINRYHKNLVGMNVLDCHNSDSQEKIKRTLEWFKADKNNNQVLEFHNEKENRDVYTVALRNDDGELIGYWEKHCYRNVDTGKRYDYK